MAHSITWKLLLGLIATAVITVVPALLQGQFANRWREPNELLAIAERMEHFPDQFGSWEMSQTGASLSEGVMRELGLAGYVSRNYKHRDSGNVVLLVLMVGPPGPLVRHPPDICLGNRANTLLSETRISVAATGEGMNGTTSEFRVLEYQPQSQLENPFHVAYAFSTGGTWNVPKWPRFTYGANPYLFKAHLQAVDSQGVYSFDDLPLKQFLRDFALAFAEFHRAEVAPLN